MKDGHTESASLSKASLRRIDRLVELLQQIQASPDSFVDLLEAFRGQYQELGREEKPWLFDAILRRLEARKEDLEGSLRRVLSADPGDPLNWSRQMTDLRRSVESPRLRAFRRFLNLSGGFKFLLDLRADVLATQRNNSFDLDPLDEELAHLFDSWSQHGFLFLQEITQESPFRQIRFLKEHDMVHPMASLEEMGHRLGGDRRCFALYHKAMPEEPVVFIEAALTHGLARSIHEILEEEQPARELGRRPDTAIFYSINNTQNGLAGLGLGKLLVFQVVDAIKQDHPTIKTFSTLSPIPGFWPRYLKPILEGEGHFLLTGEGIQQWFPERARHDLAERHASLTGSTASDLSSLLYEILSEPQWIEDPVYCRWLRKALSELTYFYLTEEKNRHGRPLNSVASFHIGNGATVQLRNVLFGGNRSERGLKDSCGMMVNYVYSSTWLQQIRGTVRALLPWNPRPAVG